MIVSVNNTGSSEQHFQKRIRYFCISSKYPFGEGLSKCHICLAKLRRAVEYSYEMAAKSKNTKNMLGGFAVGAVKSGQEGLLHVLMLAGISPDQKCKDGKSLAHHAAEYAVAVGDPDVLRKLVDYGANLYLKDSKGRTVLDILKASPKLEAEARAEWLRGSRQLGVKSLAMDTQEIQESKKQEHFLGEVDGRIRQGVDVLRKGKKKTKKIERPKSNPSMDKVERGEWNPESHERGKNFKDRDETTLGS